MTDRSARKVATPEDPLLEALVELARSAIANRREARAKLTVVDGGKRGGRAA
jgi:hypothetical protein